MYLLVKGKNFSKPNKENGKENLILIKDKDEIFESSEGGKGLKTSRYL